jgi:oligogalacturonide lyase
MAKADVIQLDYHVHADPDTGARVTRLTPSDVMCNRVYFYQKCFTADGGRLVFAGGFDGGKRNYYMLDLAKGEARQMTDGANENVFGGFLSHDDRFLYLVRAGRTLVRVDVATLEEHVVYTVPDGWVGYGTWVANSSTSRMVGIEIKAEDNRPLTDWKKFAEMYRARPRCRLIDIDLATGARRVVLDQQQWLGHPLYRPFDDTTIAFCHEGPHDLVDARMWFVDADGGNERRAKTHLKGESCTHEFFVPDGSAMIFVSYLEGESDRWICRLDPVTLKETRLMKMPPCSHLMSNADGALIVGDGTGTPIDVADPAAHAIANDPYLWLFDIEAGTHRRICRHDSSWKVLDGDRQVTHPHPSFTPDEKAVLYSCDAQGLPALYLAEIPPAA